MGSIDIMKCSFIYILLENLYFFTFVKTIVDE